MEKKKIIIKLWMSGNEFTNESVLERHPIAGSVLCAAGIMIGIWSFFSGVLTIAGILLLMTASALFLAGIYQFIGIAEIECPECKNRFMISKMQKSCKCNRCKKNFRAEQQYPQNVP